LRLEKNRFGSLIFNDFYELFAVYLLISLCEFHTDF
jgi:hypothetical protein